MILSHKLLDSGAERVIAIDRNDMFGDFINLKTVQCHFHNYKEPIHTAFISWPVNWDSGLDHLVFRSHVIIYLGTNMDGTMCGDRQLWNVLCKREILEHIPDRQNTLIIYGPEQINRELIPEECAALNGIHSVIKFDQAYVNSL